MITGFSYIAVSRASQKALKTAKANGLERTKKNNPMMALYEDIHRVEEQDKTEENDNVVRGPEFDDCMEKMREKCFEEKQWGLNIKVSGLMMILYTFD